MSAVALSTRATAPKPKISIPVFRPLLLSEDLKAATAALEMGWLGMGSYVGRFEAALHDFLASPDRHVVAVSTGHAALHLALLTAGVGPGCEVIVPSFNNIADFQAILATGAEPVFCDILDDSLCIDLDKAERLVTRRTKAVIVMDYACMLCDHRRAAALADRHGLRVIHDASHSIASRFEGRPVGGFSDVTTFSFDPIKTITCIDGGALVVRTAAEAEALREMRLIGMGQPCSTLYQDRRAWTYDVKRLGYRYHMANLHAALGLAQLSKIDVISRTRRAACTSYNQRLSQVPGVRVPETDFADVTPFLYYVRVPARRRDDLRAYLAERGIDTGIHWQPGHWFTLLRDYRRGDLSVTESVAREIVSLPLHSAMEQEIVEFVCEAIAAFFSGGWG